MLRQLKNNNRGLVLVVVLMVIAVMSILTISLISLSVSRVNLAEEETRRIKSSLFGTGALVQLFAQVQSGVIGNSVSSTEGQTADDPIDYSVSGVTGAAGTGSEGTTPLSVNVTF